MAKPIVLPEWDETEVNSVEPDATHKAEGWLAPAGVPEKPPYQSFNFWQNNVWKWLNEINIKGVLGYDNLTDYIADLSYVVGSDGYIYQCLINNGPASSTVDPVGDGTGTWLVQKSNNDNLIINQDFSIWQKAISFTNPANGVYTADGYLIAKVAGGGTPPAIDVKRNGTDQDVGFEYCCELDITNVGATGATRAWKLSQKVESFIKYQGKTVTFALRVKASVAITSPGSTISVYDGASSTNANIASITTSWVTYKVTKTIANTASQLSVWFNLLNGSGAISTTGSIYIQWMKLEISPGFTGPPIPRSEGKELALCQRRRQKSYVSGVLPGAATALGAQHLNITAINNADHGILKDPKFISRMAGIPTVTIYDLPGNPGKVTMSAGDNIAGTVLNISDNGFEVSGTNGAASDTRLLKFHYFAEYDL